MGLGFVPTFGPLESPVHLNQLSPENLGGVYVRRHDKTTQAPQDSLMDPTNNLGVLGPQPHHGTVATEQFRGKYPLTQLVLEHLVMWNEKVVSTCT